MGLYRKFILYKRILQSLFVVNIFFIVCGVVAVVRYFQTHDVTLLTIVIVGGASFLFGIVAPLLIVNRLMAVMDQMRKEAEQGLALILTGWLDNFRKSEDPLRDPQFWLNIAAILIQVFGPQFEHPMIRFITEFAPMVKVGLQKNEAKASAKKSGSRKSH